ncbi:hypothetical protein ACN28E_24935 [Archangium lansingense]|uniref:hypothetical protein n=1 Tax=Archangium lansingense TaxID=2995310 RepID=UPI003B7DA919
MRVARLQGWTLATARAQPYEDLLLIAADYLLEAEEPQPPPAAPPPQPPSSTPGRKRVARTTQFQAT